mmetsp:Transcript_21226/g.55906  ORF Transcript_21226/g.55906 Transcript_21226/m.55906 type:complete len:324 (-) Transcript_21226:626-1597(-)
MRAQWAKEAEWAGAGGAGTGRSGKRMEARMREFDFAASSDEEVEMCAKTVFAMMRREAAELFSNPLTSALASRCVLKHSNLSDSIASVLSTKLKYDDLPGVFERTNEGGARVELAAHEEALRATFAEVLARPDALRAITADLVKCYVVDPAADGVLQPALFFKGFHALVAYRVAHALWRTGSSANKGAALMLQSRASELFAVDIHPGAQIGNGVMLDHGTGVVIGGTAVLGNDLYILHQVTLGATGKPTGGAKRHPTVGSGAVLGAGSTVLGDVSIGVGATVGAAAIVTKDVPDLGTVIGVNKLVERKEQPPPPPEQEDEIID